MKECKFGTDCKGGEDCLLFKRYQTDKTLKPILFVENSCPEKYVRIVQRDWLLRRAGGNKFTEDFLRDWTTNEAKTE
ncbi:hypothetical protein JXA63_03995 [Candidatus Woesebacteria bacterium]|nr:hypothetical protein [Candidatus Woesebacteria bacterium]